MGYKLRYTGATTAATAGNGFETAATVAAGMAASAANFTASGATVTGGGTVPGLGTKGLAVHADGWWAPYTVATAGINGVITVDFWRGADSLITGSTPASAKNLTLYAISGATSTIPVNTNFKFNVIKSINVTTQAAGTVTITDVKGNTLEVITAVAGGAPIFLEWEGESFRTKGPFFVTLNPAGIMVSIGFDAQVPISLISPTHPLA